MGKNHLDRGFCFSQQTFLFSSKAGDRKWHSKSGDGFQIHNNLVCVCGHAVIRWWGGPVLRASRARKPDERRSFNLSDIEKENSSYVCSETKREYYGKEERNKKTAPDTGRGHIVKHPRFQMDGRVNTFTNYRCH